MRSARMAAARSWLTSSVALACATAALATYTEVVRAQEGESLSEVIVTAQKRAENLQDVPIAIATVNAATLAAYGTQTSQDIQLAVPGIILNRTQTNVAAIIRGVGVSSGQPGLEASVGVYVDGVYSPSAQANLFNLTSIDRVEVLRGPQGTLFGRNATGGVINIVTRDPSPNQSLDFNVGYGSYDSFLANIYGTTAVADGLATDLGLSVTTQGRGYGRNATTGRDGLRDNYEVAARNKWLWHLDDATSLTVAVAGNSGHSSLGEWVPLQGSQIPGVTNKALRTGYSGFYSPVGKEGFNTTEGGSIAARIQHDFAAVSLIDIAAFQKNRSYLATDSDGEAQQFFDAEFIGRTKTVTNELQVVSRSDSQFKWNAGLFYMDNVYKSDPQTQSNSVPVQLFVYAKLPTKSTAPYGEASYKFSEGTKLTAGVRYTHDSLGDTGRQINALGATLYSVDQHSTQTKVTYRAAIDQDITTGVMAYVSYNRGFRAGLFNSQSPNLPVLNPEVIDAYEAGLKTDLFDHRLRANLAGFAYQYTGLMLQSFDPTLGRSIIKNAAKAQVRGIDLDLEAAFAGWTMTGGAEVLPTAKYTRFPGATLTFQRPDGTDGSVIGDAAGNRMVQAPRFSGQIGARRSVSTPIGIATFAANYLYRSQMYFQSDNRYSQYGYGLLGAKIGLQPVGSQWHVDLWGENLTGTRYIQAYQAGSADIANPGRPFTFGVMIGRSW